MLNQYDPNKTSKRMGDGLYEQKLITDQIVTATGKRYIGDYSNNEAQYKALMNSGLAFRKQFGLTVGTALSAAQMAKPHHRHRLDGRRNRNFSGWYSR